MALDPASTLPPTTARTRRQLLAPCAGPEPPPATTAGVWQRLFGNDVRRLAAEILVHICGDSCFKYSGSKVTQICRHGYFYIISIVDEAIGLDWKERRRGKALRNILFVIKEEEHGMQGRVLLFQEHPFECQSNYGALAFLRSNFDVQDLVAFTLRESGSAMRRIFHTWAIDLAAATRIVSNVRVRSILRAGMNGYPTTSNASMTGGAGARTFYRIVPKHSIGGPS